MVKGIDIHVHAPTRPESGRNAQNPTMMKYFRGEAVPDTKESVYQYYKDRDLMAVILVTGPVAEDGTSLHNDWSAELQRDYPEQFIGFGGVDPKQGKLAVKEAVRCVEELGLKGFKFHPITQAFEANNPDYYELWGTISDLGVPALFHTGQTGVGAGTPGQNGIKNKYGRPYPYFDDLAADFPNLQIVMAHPSFPWVDEQLSILSVKTNVWMDLSGWSPKYFSPNLVQYANTLIKDKVMFGSDFPVFSPDRWLRDWEDVAFRDEVRQKILLENAKRLLKLEI
ncbi:MAG: amidohydrolase family protein [Dehalococcoidia bacterium]